MKYLAFLHSVMRKRRTFGNVRMTNDTFESNLDDLNLSLENFPESQNFDEDSTSLIEKDDSTQYMNYEYFNEYFNETDSTDTYTDIPIVEEPFQSLSNFSSENRFYEQTSSSIHLYYTDYQTHVHHEDPQHQTHLHHTDPQHQIIIIIIICKND